MKPAPPVTSTFMAKPFQLGISPGDLHRIAAPGKYNCQDARQGTYLSVTLVTRLGRQGAEVGIFAYLWLSRGDFLAPNLRSRFPAGMNLQFGEDPLSMVPRSVRTDFEFSGDCLVRPASGQEQGNLNLSPGKPIAVG